MTTQTKTEPSPLAANADLPPEKRLEAGDDASVLEETGSEEGGDIDIEAGPNKEEPTAETDPNLVDWDGPDDPENPMNWSDKKKWLNVATLSILTLVT